MNSDIIDENGQRKLQQILIAAVSDFAIWPQSVEIVTSLDVRAASPSCPSSPCKWKWLLLEKNVGLNLKSRNRLYIDLKCYVLCLE